LAEFADDDSRCVAKEPCPKCGSRDNLARYDDGHAFCFGCKHREPATGEAGTHQPPRRARMDNMIHGEIEAIPNRGLSRETCERYGYRVGTFKGGKAHLAPYFDATSGEMVAQKVRFSENGEKAFMTTGDIKTAGLFGHRLLEARGGRMVVITEGEIDALSCSQALGNSWPVLSLPKGAMNAARAIGPFVKELEKYDAVVLCFDADEPGREAVAACATLFSPGKLRVAQLPDDVKDANDLVRTNRSKALSDALFGASPYRLDGIRSVADLREQARTRVVMGRPWPYPSLTAATYGIRRKELYGLGAGVGCGKTETFKEFIVETIAPEGVLDDGLPVGLLFLEEPPAHTLKVLAGKLVGKLFHIPGVEYEQQELDDALDLLVDKVFVYDHFGAKGYEDVKSRITYMVSVLGIKDIYLDHLTALVAGVDDERRSLDHIMADLAGMAERLDFTLYYISHLSTPDGKPHEEGGRVYERHFAGSRAIARWSHFMFALERDKQDPDGVTTFRVLKDRYTGRATGLTFGLAYGRDSGRLTECALPSPDTPSFKDERAHDDI
jgi:twinkle protein